MFETLKLMLKDNLCTNRGYILEGMPVNLNEVNKLYFSRQEIKEEDEDYVQPEEEAGEEGEEKGELEEGDDSGEAEDKPKKPKSKKFNFNCRKTI